MPAARRVRASAGRTFGAWRVRMGARRTAGAGSTRGAPRGTLAASLTRTPQHKTFRKLPRAPNPTHANHVPHA